MAGNDCAGSLQVCRMRVSRLGADGVPVPGANNLYVTDALIRLGFDPEVVEGQEFEQPNGCGDIAISFKDVDRIKRFNLTMELVTPDPELHELLIGGSVLTSGGNTRGYKYPELGKAAAQNGVSIEAWTKAVIGDEQAATNPWWRWVFTRTKWRPGGKVLENGVLANPLTGFAIENPNWFDGPANDWDYDSDRAIQFARDPESAVPAASCGYQTLAAS